MEKILRRIITWDWKLFYIRFMIEIQKGIELPPDTRGRKTKYPFAQMQVGDSFEVTGPRNTVLTAATSWAKRRKNKHQFTIRHSNGKTRIWRTK